MLIMVPGPLKKIKRGVAAVILKFLKLLEWHYYRLTHQEVNLVVGAGGITLKDWFITDIVTLDVTKEHDFQKYFRKTKVDRILAEHILEHLSDDELDSMLANFYKYSSEKVNIRVAVPDGWHTDANYLERVKVNGVEGGEDHKHLFTYKSLPSLFGKQGFVAHLLEYWDEQGNFHTVYLNDGKGHVRRSFIHDARNRDGRPHYTSLIIDFTKQ